ncbi:MAG: 50S ribosomal protein L29 [Oligoflexia bacterium]|nr:50S ribosomal protein L29 [Oligoflexia bacterium]
MMSMADIQKMDLAGIDVKVSELRRELFNLRIKKKTTGIDKPHTIVNIRKGIARLLTVRTMKLEEMK